MSERSYHGATSRSLELPNVDIIVYNVIKKRIYDTFKQQCCNRIMTTPKGILYKHLGKRIQITELP